LLSHAWAAADAVQEVAEICPEEAERVDPHWALHDALEATPDNDPRFARVAELWNRLGDPAYEESVEFIYQHVLAKANLARYLDALIQKLEVMPIATAPPAAEPVEGGAR